MNMCVRGHGYTSMYVSIYVSPLLDLYRGTDRHQRPRAGRGCATAMHSSDPVRPQKARNFAPLKICFT
jgi:hypothetical protein